MSYKEYKKAKTRLEHDIDRQKFINELNYLRLCWEESHDYVILSKIIKYEDMLALYDREMGYEQCLRSF